MATTSDTSTKIPLYARRTLGEKINAAIDFLRQNWRVALRFSIYMMLPLALIQSGGMFTIVRSMSDDSFNNETDLGVLSSTILSLIVLCFTYTLILTLFQYYQGSSDGDLSMLTFRDVKSQMWHNLKRVLKAMLPIIVIMALSSLLVFFFMLLPFISLLVFLIYALLFFILMIVPIHYVLESVNLREAFNRCFSHASASWGNLFGLMFSMVLVVMIIQSVTGMPMLVFAFATNSLSYSGTPTAALSVTYDIVLYLFLIVQTFFGYLSMSLVITTLVYHYGSNAREQDDLAIASDIDDFANL